MNHRSSIAERDIVIIGGGAGGLVVASVAAQLGLKTTLIEKAPTLGGDCLHYGCVPSKALLKAAHTVHAAQAAGSFGLRVQPPPATVNEINAWVRRAVDIIQRHDSDERFESFGCEVVHAQAQFTSDRTVRAGDTEYRAARFVVATGSTATIPPVQGLDAVPYLTNQELFSLPTFPGSLLVLGGGPVGVEMAQAWARLGSRVTLVEAAERILPPFDRDLSQTLADQLKRDGIDIVLQSIRRVYTHENSVRMELDNGDSLQADRLLVAAGRQPVVEGLGLEQAGVDFDSKGIHVNHRMQTSNRRIYAVGDVTGVMPFTHVAEQQAGVVIANTCFRVPRKMDYRVVPAVVFTEPEIAQVGMPVAEAGKDPSCSVLRFDLSDLDRAVADGQTDGLLKIVVRKGRIRGAHMAGNRAGEVIHELALAIQVNMKISRLASMVHAYPGYSQIVRRAAAQHFRDSLFSARTRKLVQFLNRWLP